jgi:hypothetical protein
MEPPVVTVEPSFTSRAEPVRPPCAPGPPTSPPRPRSFAKETMTVSTLPGFRSISTVTRFHRADRGLARKSRSVRSCEQDWQQLITDH